MTENLEYWMTNLPEKAKQMSVIYLAIPGSHDSMSYSINKHSKISPDADETVRKLNRFFPKIVRRWAKTQNVDAIKQLNLGIRYFDLRICLKDECNFYFAHGLYSCEVFNVLKQMNEFLNTHPQEFIILDFQHFYNLNINDHWIFQNKIIQIFGNKLYGKNDGTLIDCSLEYTKNLGKQVLVVYRRCCSIPDTFWNSDYWPTPWPNTCSFKILQQFLINALNDRLPSTGYVSQCIITPSSRYIIARFIFSLKSCAKRVNRKILPWIESQHIGCFKFGDKPCINVFIVDFVDMRNAEFCKTVIHLNQSIN